MSKSVPSLEVEIDSGGAIHPSTLEPQHGTSSEEEDDSETMTSDADGTILSFLGNRDCRLDFRSSLVSGLNQN